VVRIPGYKYRGSLPDFRRNSGSRTGSTQLREYNGGATWKKKVVAPVYRTENTAVRDLSRWPRGTLCSQNLALTSRKSSGRLAGTFRSQTQAMEFLLFFVIYFHVVLSIVVLVQTLVVNLIRGEIAPLARPAKRFETGSHIISLVNSTCYRLKITFVRDLSPCSSVHRYERFGGTCFLHL
jgi:hypothetical protein